MEKVNFAKRIAAKQQQAARYYSYARVIIVVDGASKEALIYCQNHAAKLSHEARAMYDNFLYVYGED